MVLEPLEDSPLALWELAWTDPPDPVGMAEVCGPGLVSLAARGFIEVRRFGTWPAAWDDGHPVTGDELTAASRLVESWSDGGALPCLAAHITRAGIGKL